VAVFEETDFGLRLAFAAGVAPGVALVVALAFALEIALVFAVPGVVDVLADSELSEADFADFEDFEGFATTFEPDVASGPFALEVDAEPAGSETFDERELEPLDSVFVR
jgi:hypothetical protein